jgi:hypothetical protein
MSDQQQKSPSGASASGFWSLLEMLFLGLALFALAGAVGAVLYEVWGFVTGQGWNHLFVGSALDWLLGMPPLEENMGTFHRVLAVIAILPLDITLAVSGWLLSKISNGFEKLT